MKKRNLLVSLLVGVVVVSSLAGCGSDKKSDKTTETAVETAMNDTEVVSESVSEVTSEVGVKTDENGVYLGDYSGFTYQREYVAPTEDDLDQSIQDVLDSNATREYKETGTVEDGATIVVSFTGSIDGQVMAELSGEEEEITIGEETFWAEFEDAMIGHNVGEEFEVSLTFPDDYEESDIAGKTADFTVVVNKIAGELHEVKLTDEWVAANSKYKTVDEYKAGMMKGLEMQAEEYADSSAVYSLISNLYEVSYADVSDEEVADEFNAQIAIYKNDAESMGMTYEDYVEDSYAGQFQGAEDVVQAFEDNVMSYVKEDVEKQKILYAFAAKEDVDLSDEAYNAYLEREAEMYGYESKDAFVEELVGIGYETYIRTIFEELQVGKKLMELSTLVEPTVVEPETSVETEIDSNVGDSEDDDMDDTNAISVGVGEEVMLDDITAETEVSTDAVE